MSGCGEQLIASPKERAEHIMLVDLERNDLGRVCEPGSVEVSELMTVCSYAHVHHIESSVRGRLRENMTPSEVMRALFPGGTITGCPKVRTMQIINELEPSPRYAYTGSMGYLNLDGSMDLNILIRSFMLEGNALTFKAGAGIVADSDPLRELGRNPRQGEGAAQGARSGSMILVNGIPSEHVRVFDRGLTYGDGVFRTLLVRAGHPLCWPRHYDKLYADCAALGIVCPPEDILAAEMVKLISRNT